MQPSFHLSKAHRAGFFLIHLYAFSAWFNPILNHIAFIGLAGLGTLHRPTRAWLIQRTEARCAMGFAVLILALSLKGMLEFPHALPGQALTTSKWVLLSGFAFLLPWLSNSRIKPENLFGLALLGLLIGMLLHTAPGKLLRFNIGSDHTNWQPHFQFSTAGMAGLSGGLSLLGLLMFKERFFEEKNGAWRLKGPLWLIAVYLSGYMLIASQSRVSWLALGVTLPLGLLLRRKKAKGTQPVKRPHTANLMMLVVAFALIFGAWKNLAIFQERMTRDLEVFSATKTERFEGSSTGLRLKMMEFGLQSFSEHPILGWGNRGSASIAKEKGNERYRSPEPDGRLIWFPHLHNTYLEILVRFGGVGFLMFIAALLSCVLRLKRSLREETNPNALNVEVFTGMGLLFFAICGLAGFQIMQEEWRAPFSLLLALSFGAFTKVDGSR